MYPVVIYYQVILHLLPQNNENNLLYKTKLVTKGNNFSFYGQEPYK